MKITLENIGKVKHADVELKGLTVITGGNNSGKTTTGKVLFSLLNVVLEHERKAEIDKKIGMDIILRDIRHSLDDIQRILYRFPLGDKVELFDEYVKSIYVFIRKPLIEKKYDEFKQLLLSINEEIYKLLSRFDSDEKDNENLLLGKNCCWKEANLFLKKQMVFCIV